MAQDIGRLLHIHCPAAAIDTEGYKDWAYRNVIRWLLRDDFSFHGAVVGEKGKSLNTGEIYRSFCREHDILSVQEIKAFSEDLGYPVNWKAILREKVRVNADTFIPKDGIDFNIEAVDTVLESMIPGEYAPLKEITLWLQFPAAQYPWNPFLLLSYLYHYSQTFCLYYPKLIENGTPGAAMRREAAAKYPDYKALIVDVLSKSDVLDSEEAAKQYLVDYGYRVTRENTNIKGILQAAFNRKMQRENKQR